MKTQVYLLAISALAGAFASAVLIATPASAAVSLPKKLSWCEAQRVVEMRNAVLDASLLCSKVVTADDYNSFIRANRERIKFANTLAVTYHMKRFGSRSRFDKLDSYVMNINSAIAAKDPAAFCEKMKSIKAQIKTKTIDQLLATQTELQVPVCD